MGGVDAEDLQLAREEGQLLKRQRQWAVLGMRLDIRVELRRRKRAADAKKLAVTVLTEDEWMKLIR